MSKKHARAVRHMLPAAATLLLVSTSPAFAHHAGSATSAGSAGGLTTLSPGTLHQGGLEAALESEYVGSDAFSDATLIAKAGNHIHAHSVDYALATSLNASYGLTDDLTLSLRLPHVYRDNIRAGHHSHSGSGVSNTVDAHGNSGGLGDPSLLGKYRFLHDEENGIDSALLLGIKVPLGTTTQRHEDETLDAEFQPGTGSVDGLGGLAVAKSFGPVSLGISGLYVLTGEGTQDTDLGDRFTGSLGVVYRIGGETHHHEGRAHAHTHAAWDLMLETSVEWADKQKNAGVEEKDSGGTEVFISPGLRYTAEAGWSAYSSVSLPVAHDMGAGHTDTAVKLLAGLSKAF